MRLHHCHDCVHMSVRVVAFTFCSRFLSVVHHAVERVAPLTNHATASSDATWDAGVGVAEAASTTLMSTGLFRTFAVAQQFFQLACRQSYQWFVFFGTLLFLVFIEEGVAVRLPGLHLRGCRGRSLRLSSSHALIQISSSHALVQFRLCLPSAVWLLLGKVTILCRIHWTPPLSESINHGVDLLWNAIS